MGRLRYNDATRRKVLDAISEHGSNEAAGAAIGVTGSCVGKWQQQYPEFAADCAAAYDRYCEGVGRLAVDVLRKHLRAAVDGTPTGTKTRTVKGELVSEDGFCNPDPNLVKMALTRLDARFTHPKQDVKVEVHQFSDALDGISDKVAAGEDAPAPPDRIDDTT